MRAVSNLPVGVRNHATRVPITTMLECSRLFPSQGVPWCWKVIQSTEKTISYHLFSHIFRPKNNHMKKLRMPSEEATISAIFQNNDPNFYLLSPSLIIVQTLALASRSNSLKLRVLVLT